MPTTRRLRTSTRIALGYFTAECDRGLRAIVAGAIADGEVPPGSLLDPTTATWIVPDEPAVDAPVEVPVNGPSDAPLEHTPVS